MPGINLFTLSVPALILAGSGLCFATVRGTIRNQSGRPVSGAIVFTTASDTRDTSDTGGVFRIYASGMSSHDSLVIKRRGEVVWKGEVGSGDSLSITLDLVPHEIVEIAMSQVGRGPDEVGKGRDQYPFELSRYMPKGAAWCSEFLSWAYLAAGYPLTGGSSGGWMIPTNTRLRRWFSENTRFVERTDPHWDGTDPNPGDFIRYHTDFGGHTGIVVRTEGATLVTVEGNLSNKVRVRRVSNWRKRLDIDGFGLRSGYRAPLVNRISPVS